MTLPEVAATIRRSAWNVRLTPEEVANDVVRAFEADADFRLRERVEEARQEAPTAGWYIENDDFVAMLALFDRLLGPSPGPSLRERMEEARDERWRIAQECRNDPKNAVDYTEAAAHQAVGDTIDGMLKGRRVLRSLPGVALDTPPAAREGT